MKVAYIVAVLLMFLVGRVIVTAVTKETEDRIDGARPESDEGGDAGGLTPGPESAPGGSPAEGSPAIEDDGTHLLGEDLAPGRYVADPAENAFCFWERHSGPKDTSGGQEHVIASGGPGDDRFLVEVAASDHAFASRDCGDWYPYVPPAQPSTTIPPGEWAVGEDIEPGTYVSAGGEFCNWAFYSGFGRSFEEFVDGSGTDGAGSATIVVEPTHALLTTGGCEDWTKQ